jgi:uracil-DNA glycosylase
MSINRSERVRAVQELLAFYIDAGVDIAVGETAIDRFAGVSGAVSDRPPGDEPPPRPSVAPLPVPTPRPRVDPNASMAAAPAAPEAAVMAARETARRAETLEALRGVLEKFEGCTLKATAKRLVFADGNPQGRIMFVGEAPGRDEDLEGVPFVGRAGQLLNRMMAAIELDRSAAYIANIIPWRPPGNRTPTPQEAAICLPFVLRQIELADPDILVCLGGPSAMALLGVKDGILKIRGRWFSYQTGRREIRAIPTLHPAYLLRQPLQKRLAWRDFLAIRKVLTT